MSGVEPLLLAILVMFRHNFCILKLLLLHLLASFQILLARKLKLTDSHQLDATGYRHRGLLTVGVENKYIGR